MEQRQQRRHRQRQRQVSSHHCQASHRLSTDKPAEQRAWCTSPVLMFTRNLTIMMAHALLHAGQQRGSRAAEAPVSPGRGVYDFCIARSSSSSSARQPITPIS